MAIIGRTDEIKRLENYYYSGKPEFLIIYGRRRVGKTFLIKEHFKSKFAFYFTGSIDTPNAVKLANFDNAIIEYGGDNEIPSKDWNEAFHKLKSLLNRSAGVRKVVFFDEMPWLDNRKSGFLQAFDYFWNSWASSNKDILFIGCGSATSWISKKIFKNRGGLHNRVTGRIHLAPFTIGECEMFFRSRGFEIDRYGLIECYMVFGGIPYYLDLFNKSWSLAQNVDYLCFSKNAQLYDEFDELFMSLFANPDRHIKIIEVLSRKNSGLTRNEISEAGGFHANGHLTSALNELEMCDFIEVYTDTKKRKKGSYYFITDPFVLFYLRYMKDNNRKDEHFWAGNIDDGSRNAWRGYAFEQLCRIHLWQIKKALGISGVSTVTSSWRSSTSKPGAQVDLVIRRKDRITNLCEMKYTNKPFVITKNYADALHNKKLAFIEDTGIIYGIHLTMITTYGVSKSGYISSINSEVTMDDLFD